MINDSKIVKFKNVINWIIFGIFYLIGKTIIDRIAVLRKIFSPLNINKSDEKNRFKTYIETNEIKAFLEFIHSRGKDKNNDLQSLFKDYTNFDIKIKEDYDENIKARVSYLDKLIKGDKLKINRKASTNYSTFFLFNDKKTNHDSTQIGNRIKSSSQDSNYRRICRRNLIIIEILENFLINDGTDNYIVDIDKLKNLLPKTTKLNNQYMKRLLYTDIKSLNLAITKNNSSKNVKKELRAKLLNRTIWSTIFLDTFIDNNKSDNHLKDYIDEDISLEGKNCLNELSNTLTNINEIIKESLDNYNYSVLEKSNHLKYYSKN